MIDGRRKFLKSLGLVTAAASTGVALTDSVSGAVSPLQGSHLLNAGKDISPQTGKERRRVPSACWQCVARDGIIGYVEDGRVVHLEGNPELPRTNGKLCARGQGGVGQVYNPDRLLFPLKRVGKRGEGKWKRITWDQALEELVGKLKELQDKGKPEKFMFHYGRMKGSSSTIIKKYFLPAYGTGTYDGHTAICESAKWTAQELVWGKHYDVNDVARTNYILNFGSNFFEAHTSHIPLEQRALAAQKERGVKIVTFDVRFTNTAAKSDEWFPVKPGTDAAVVLAMCHVIMKNNLHDAEFIETWTNTSVAELKRHLKEMTPQWAERISGVPAEDIERIALEYGRAKPGTCVSYRGLATHYNGVENHRAVKMLDAICGYIDVPGGTCPAVGAKWKNSFKPPKTHPKKLKRVYAPEGAFKYPTHHSCHQVLSRIKSLPPEDRPEIYMVFCYNPVYVNGNCRENIKALKDESAFPYVVVSDVAYSETAALADLLLPDATYLERWDTDNMVSFDMIHEYYIRQPVVEPLAEARNFVDVACEIARRLGGKTAAAFPFQSAREFVLDACEHTPGVKKAGGFRFMTEHGAWYDPSEKPHYQKHLKKLDKAEVEANLKSGKWAKNKYGTVYDPAKAVKGKGKYGADGGSWKDYKAYVCQEVNGEYYVGFKPDKIAKSGLLELKSPFIEKAGVKGFTALPSYVPIPEHQAMRSNQLILTTYKVNVQTHSRTQGCKYLSEIYHDNPAWINRRTAAPLGIEDGDRIKVRSEIGEIVTKARVTEAVQPGIISISYHCGHWQWGRFATAGKVARPLADPRTDALDPDINRIWWKENGEHPNWVIPNKGDPIGGMQRWMDTVVTVEKA
jgi:anaerobic selenocysteine-containing dehydrogenase